MTTCTKESKETYSSSVTRYQFLVQFPDLLAEKMKDWPTNSIRLCGTIFGAVVFTTVIKLRYCHHDFSLQWLIVLIAGKSIQEKGRGEKENQTYLHAIHTNI